MFLFCLVISWKFLATTTSSVPHEASSLKYGKTPVSRRPSVHFRGSPSNLVNDDNTYLQSMRNPRWRYFHLSTSELWLPLPPKIKVVWLYAVKFSDHLDSQINLRLHFAFISDLFRVKKSTWDRAGFQPLTLSMVKPPMRYDALTNSATKASVCIYYTVSWST